MGPATGSRPRYDRIGHGYSRFRREDPEIVRRIDAALGPARSIVNVGAGAGSYEPRDRRVLAVEPSKVMAAQRPPDAAPLVRGVAQALPLADGSVDAAIAVLSVHHWHPEQERGVREMRRVARDRIVILTIDPEVSGKMWLMRDYLPEVARLDSEIFPDPASVAQWLGGAEVATVPVSRRTPDWTLLSFWAHPERVLDEQACKATSGFARMAPEVVRRVRGAVGDDLADGTWDARYGELRRLESYDAGLRLITASVA